MRKEDFDSDISHVWGAHAAKMRAIFQRSRVLSDPVHQRMEQLHRKLAQVILEETKILWGPARYNLETEDLSVPYEITCEKIGRSFHTTIVYRPSGAMFDGKRFDEASVDALLLALTRKVYEAFLPPEHREVEIYPVRPGPQ